MNRYLESLKLKVNISTYALIIYEDLFGSYGELLNKLEKDKYEFSFILKLLFSFAKAADENQFKDFKEFCQKITFKEITENVNEINNLIMEFVGASVNDENLQEYGELTKK
ncbi:hypothetical protein M1771_04130 [Spiroplasma citri]|uniref:hypothetical protein n=1 Tax=Spiroplasma citri TaxID=2133 RepID=UPI002412DE37|nr:hypothetical protein [Spiroplasma citri]WFH01095.1 hypothetical protein M1771_04130 [Spiroplasma citri]